MATPPPSEVARKPISESSSSFRSEAIDFGEPGVARVKPTGKSWVFCVFLMLVGIAVIVFGLIPDSWLGFVGDDVEGPPGTIGKFFTGVSWFFRIVRLVMCVGVGGGFVVLGVVVLGWGLFRVGMTFDRRRGVLRMKRRHPLLGRQVLLRDIAAVQLLAVKGKNNCEMNLVLSHPQGERLPVMCHANLQAIDADARRLAEFLRIPLLDHTREEVEGGARSLSVPTHVVEGRSAGTPLMKLRQTGPELMVIQATIQGRILPTGFLVGGLLGIGIGIVMAALYLRPTASECDWLDMTTDIGVPLIGGAIFLLAALAYRSGTSPVTFDRAARVVRGKPLTVEGVRVGQIPLRDVAALQVCSKMESCSEGSKVRVYQLLLVLCRPPDARAPLIQYTDEADMRKESRQLAEFLKVPLLDHSGE